MSPETATHVIFAEHIFAMECSLFICFSYFRFTELRTVGFTLVFFLSLCDALGNLSYVVFPSEPEEGTAKCVTQALMVSLFTPASILWSLAISLQIYATVRIADIEEGDGVRE